MQVFFIALAILSGAGISMQAAMLGAVGTARTPAAAVWISLLATVVGLTAFVIYRSATSSIGLPPPFDRPYIMIAFAIAATVALAFSARDIEWYYVLTGLMPIPFLVGAGFLAPRLGVGLFISAVIAGQLTAAVLLDHIGAFGGNLIRADYIRLARHSRPHDRRRPHPRLSTNVRTRDLTPPHTSPPAPRPSASDPG